MPKFEQLSKQPKRRSDEPAPSTFPETYDGRGGGDTSEAEDLLERITQTLQGDEVTRALGRVADAGSA